jgi:hypothetical protein
LLCSCPYSLILHSFHVFTQITFSSYLIFPNHHI